LAGIVGAVFQRRKGIRVRQRIRRLELWPVFKLAVAFHAICGAISLGVLVLFWNLAKRAGYIERLKQFLIDYRFADGVTISGPTVFRGATMVVLAIALLNAFVTMLLALLYNLLSGLLGGLIVSIVEDDMVRVSKTARATAKKPPVKKEKLPKPAKSPTAEKSRSSGSEAPSPTKSNGAPNNPSRAGLDLPDDDLDDTDWLTDLKSDDDLN
jgi:hypothetical protein